MCSPPECSLNSRADRRTAPWGEGELCNAHGSSPVTENAEKVGGGKTGGDHEISQALSGADSPPLNWRRKPWRTRGREK